MIRHYILGKWFQEKYIAKDDTKKTKPITYEFFPDGTFSYSFAYLTGSGEHRSTYSGKWSISDGMLIQEWPAIHGNAAKKTSDTVSMISASRLDVYTHISTFYRCYRAPKYVIE